MPNFSAALAKISLHSVTIDLSDGTRIRAQVPSSGASNLGIGASVNVTLKSLPVFVKGA